MLSRLPQRTRRAAPAERVVLLVCFAALLAVLAILGTARTAHAADPAPSEPELQLAEEDWELEEEECLEAESEEEIEAACEEEGEDESAPCPIRSANAHLAERHGRLKLTIGYTTSEPTPAKVTVQNSGTKVFKRMLSRSGVLRLTENAGTLNTKVVIRIEAVGWDGCPSRRLVLFRSESRGASQTRPHRKS